MGFNRATTWTQTIPKEGMGINFTAEVTGIQQLEKILDGLEKKIRKAYMIDVFKSESKELIWYAKYYAPESEKKSWVSHHRHYTKKKGFHIISKKHDPGELKASIRGFVGKSKMGSYWIGPQFGKGRKPDAYYAHFVMGGTKRIRTANPFMKRAWDETKGTVINNINNRLKRDIEEYLRTESAKIA